jgi:hypothetical protein
MFDMEIPVCVRTPTAELRGSCLASGYLLKPKSRRYKKTIDATISMGPMCWCVGRRP